jgi:hypothetical protein
MLQQQPIGLPRVSARTSRPFREARKSLFRHLIVPEKIVMRNDAHAAGFRIATPWRSYG